MSVIDTHQKLVDAGIPQVAVSNWYGDTRLNRVFPLCWVRRAPNSSLWLHYLWLVDPLRGADVIRLRCPPERSGRLKNGPLLTEQQWSVAQEVAQVVSPTWTP